MYALREWFRISPRGPDEDLELLEGDLRRTVHWLRLAVAIGLVVVALWAVATAASWRQTVGLFALTAITAGAAAATGAALGFLFGVPRIGRPEGEGSEQARLAFNTNLVEVSDWLTKLLLGATLVQIGDLAGYIGQIAGALADPSVPGHRGAVAAVLVYFFVVGFLGFYLVTQIYLTLAFKRASDYLSPSEDEESLQRVAKALRAVATGSQPAPAEEDDLRKQIELLRARLGDERLRRAMHQRLGVVARHSRVRTLLGELAAPEPEEGGGEKATARDEGRD
ncbi:hypothetical protein HRbin40_02288 [bacterium HR40]|nr:hypothetical protein HRbin40_02288 [bacterium HR40]